jgi:hypothetical protein
MGSTPARLGEAPLVRLDQKGKGLQPTLEAGQRRSTRLISPHQP